MWKGPIFLQVFASHFNITAGRCVPIPELDSEDQGHEGAMALAAAAVCDSFLHSFLSYNLGAA